jgi:hypothetical protein
MAQPGVTREAPAQAELRPTCAGASYSTPTRGFPRPTRLRRHPFLNQSFESTTKCAAIGLVRQKMGDAKIQHLVRAGVK